MRVISRPRPIPWLTAELVTDKVTMLNLYSSVIAGPGGDYNNQVLLGCPMRWRPLRFYRSVHRIFNGGSRVIQLAI